MTDLVEFLLARIAEDEAVARAATVGPWASKFGTEVVQRDRPGNQIAADCYGP